VFCTNRAVVTSGADVFGIWLWFHWTEIASWACLTVGSFLFILNSNLCQWFYIQSFNTKYHHRVHWIANSQPFTEILAIQKAWDCCNFLTKTKERSKPARYLMNELQKLLCSSDVDAFKKMLSRTLKFLGFLVSKGLI
jgi:hypothetical protein